MHWVTLRQNAGDSEGKASKKKSKKKDNSNESSFGVYSDVKFDDMKRLDDDSDGDKSGNCDSSDGNINRLESESECDLDSKHSGRVKIRVKQMKQLMKYNFEHFSRFDEVLYNVHRQLNSATCDASDSNTCFSHIRVTNTIASASQVNVFDRGQRRDPLKVKFKQLKQEPTGNDFKFSLYSRCY